MRKRIYKVIVYSLAGKTYKAYWRKGRLMKIERSA